MYQKPTKTIKQRALFVFCLSWKQNSTKVHCEHVSSSLTLFPEILCCCCCDFLRFLGLPKLTSRSTYSKHYRYAPGLSSKYHLTPKGWGGIGAEILPSTNQSVFPKLLNKDHTEYGSHIGSSPTRSFSIIPVSAVPEALVISH